MIMFPALPPIPSTIFTTGRHIHTALL